MVTTDHVIHFRERLLMQIFLQAGALMEQRIYFLKSFNTIFPPHIAESFTFI
jgi:hypothetical protein